MRDTLLAAMLHPTNFVACFSRWPNGAWAIQSVSLPNVDTMKLIHYVESNSDYLSAILKQKQDTGAVSEMAIIHASFREIEEVNLTANR